ncbi:hypothetical protein BDU57DRAFT_522933 [Ampelomyces quisqualis]|uniref:Uncharacterized protein n=1 Tax=Ampelomyces quisqualis TaxID=50730 RepID=A0A6A5QAP3_AMPQU|nr:hypothetical protein BDU57DRAFT_522933 [Ampelomyces quisqualis]
MKTVVFCTCLMGLSCLRLVHLRNSRESQVILRPPPICNSYWHVNRPWVVPRST